MKTYGIYKMRFVTDLDFFGKKLNGWYDLSFFIDYPDYKHPKIEKVEDGDSLVSNNLLKTDFRPFVVTHSMTPDEISALASSIPTEFSVTVLSSEEMTVWMRDETNAQETNPGEFLISEGGTYMGQNIPPKFLTIA